MTFGEVLARETAAAIGRERGKRRHLHANRKHIAIGAKPVGFSPGGLHFVRVAVIEHLDLDTLRQAGLSGSGEFFDRGRRGPHEDTGVPCGLLMAPLDNHLEVFELFHGAHYAHRLAGAVQHAVLPAPSVVGAVHLRKVLRLQVAKAGLRVVDECANRVGGQQWQ